jgi:hypothetical protein
MHLALRGLVAATAALTLAGGGSSARAQAVATYSCRLDGPQTVPFSSSTATGRASLSLDADNNLTYSFEFFNLVGSPNLVNIHGPAGPGDTGAERFRLIAATSGSDVLGPLFENELAWLNAGLLYMEAHTSVHPSGEIRGQIYNTLAVEGRTWSAVKQLFE